MAFRNFEDNWSESEDNDDDFEIEFDAEAQTHSNFQMVSGRVTVGDYVEDDAQESARYSVEFEAPFNPDGPVPMVFCQAEGELDQDYPDVFGVTLIETTHEGFSVNIGRGGGTKVWGQQLNLNWIAMIAVGHPMVSVQQIDVGDNLDASSKVATVRFAAPLPGGQAPFIMATCVGDDYPDSFAVTLKKLTRNGARFQIARLGEHGQTWGQNVRLNVCYFAQGLFPCLRVTIGDSTDDDGAAGPEANIKKIENIEYGGRLRRRPLPFVMVQHCVDADPGWGDSFCASVGNVNNGSLQLNVMRADANNGWGQDARALICLIP